MRKLLLSISVFISIPLFAQVPLNSFVGPTHLPADSDPISEIPIYPETTTNLAEPLEGQLVHDFKLYTLEGDSVQLSGVLNDGKPILLVGCNYTCYVFRGKIDVINEMQSLYGDQINIFLMYTVEAHPVVDFSPYFGYENVGADNYAEGILYRQPTTYGERKEIVADMLANETINVPVLIDGPTNEVWLNYGTNPNPGWLIAPDGIVYDAQKWFDKEPDNMYASIDSILNLVGEGTYTPQGTFDAVDEGETIYYGTVENTIAAHITLTNTSDDDVLIDFVRAHEEIPAGWFTAMCTDLCYSPDIDSTTVFLPPGATEIVRVDFFTDNIPASGSVEIHCVNHYDASNEFNFTIQAQSVAEADAIQSDLINNAYVIYPNPAEVHGKISIDYLPKSQDAKYALRNLQGANILNGVLNGSKTEVSIAENISAGIYLLMISDGQLKWNTKLVITE